ncbi:MAG: hypothetical protein PHV34_08945 [Verrucomicrobiae bacterium]|nr:hypothetical protein [Verrucomicrobiae bacterium]
MAIILEANYSKKLGLPHYSSHQYAITLRTELSGVNEVHAESQRLYAILQAAVDREMQKVGFLPDPESHGHNGNGGNGHNGNGHSDVWACSDKQKELILNIVQDNNLDKNEVEALARERFNTPVKALNKLEASGLIDELLEKYGSRHPRGRGNGCRRGFHRAGAR